jgi:hypothetical protein
MRCGGRNVPVKNVRDDPITIVVRRDGDRLVGSGSIEDGRASLTLDRTRGDRYKGSRRERVQGGRATVRFDWRMVSEERLVGSATAKVRARGLLCTVKRDQEATWLGSS